MAKRTVTLDMDSSSIRLLEVAGQRVVRWGSAAVEPGMVKNGIVANPKAAGAVIRGLMRSSGIAAAPVVASVAGVYSLSRILSLPVLPGAVAERALLTEARQVLPVPLEELYVSWRPLLGKDGEHQYLLVGVPREAIDSRVLALRAAGLSPQAVSLKALALTLVAGSSDALIVNVEPSSLDVVVVVDAVPRVLHSVALAEEGLSPEERAKVAARDLRLAVDFYRSRYPLSRLSADTPLFLTGPLMSDAGFASTLVNAVDYSVTTLTPPLEYPRHLPVAQYAVNLGLALSQVSPLSTPGGEVGVPLPVINLLPQKLRPRRFTIRQGAVVLAFAAALVALVGLYRATSSAIEETRSLRQQMDRVNIQLQQIRQQNVIRGQLQRQLEEYRGLTFERAVMTGYLKLLEENKPVGVQITSAGFSSKGIGLRVSASSWEQAEVYTEALRNTGRFSSVSLPTEAGEETAEGRVSFTIEANFPPGGPQYIR